MGTMGKSLTRGISKRLGAAAILLLLISQPVFARLQGPVAQTGGEAIQTDKSDYLVSEPVRITGTGFLPRLDLTVRIVLPDGSSGDFPAVADEAGNLDFVYEPTLAGAYAATVLGPGEAHFASLSFTTAAAGAGVPAVAAIVKNPFEKLPLAFVPNAGQTDERVRFSVHAGSGATFFFTGEEAVFVFRKGSKGAAKNDGGAKGIVLRLGFLGANTRTAVEGREPGTGKVNYLIGNDPNKWFTDLPIYGQVVYRDLWKGIDMVFRGDASRLKYEFVVRPGAKIEDIQLGYGGAEKLAVDTTGELLIETALGALKDVSPVSYQEVGGRRVPVESRFLLRPDARHAAAYGFAVGKYDSRQPLVIDPGLQYSTFLGGSSTDLGNPVAVDALGHAYVTGETNSPDFPTTVGAFDTTWNTNIDAFVTKLNTNVTGILSLVYSTFLGGTNGADRGFGIALDSAVPPNVYVTGETNSNNFPTTATAFDTSSNGSADVFVTKLNTTLVGPLALAYSTYLGGGGSDIGTSIAVEGGGTAHVTGRTNSSSGSPFGMAGGFDATYNSGDDVFVTKLNTNLAGAASRVYSTYLGGGSDDRGFGITLDSAGNTYVTGETNSSGSPTNSFGMAGGFDPTYNGGFDVFVTKLNTNLTLAASRLYSTYLGGSSDDRGRSIAVDGAMSAYITGLTAGTFPTTAGAFDTIANGGDDAFVTKLNAAGSAPLVYSTYLGGSSFDRGFGIALDSAGGAHVTGETDSGNFPTTPGAFDAIKDGIDAFVTELNPAGSAPLTYSTFLGGGNADRGFGIAVDFLGNAYVTGETNSSDFPTGPLAFDTTINGNNDAFVTKFELAVCGDATVEGAEQCDQGAAMNGTPGSCCSSMCTFRPSTFECRPSAGVCDVAESCTGSSASCPADAKSTAECRASAGVCDVAESCDGVNNNCPADAFQPPTTVCRTGSGDLCDPNESCTGASAACPPDVVAPSTTVCNPGSGDVCDPDETCTGTAGQACPADNVAAGGTVCNPGSGDVCDPDEVCSGTPDQPCPTDTIAPITTVCRTGSGDVCDPDEMCTGAPDAACPADVVAPSTTTCRASAGVCDPGEQCTGTAGQACPTDAKSTAECRASAGVCDLSESCDGVNNDCPADVKSTAVCRPSADVCDASESCDGLTNDCPMDVFQPPTTVCRASAGVCDVPDLCTGTGPACPADAFVPDGTECPDTDLCNGTETCDDGQCVAGTPPTCNDSNPCTTDSCTPATGCVNTPNTDPCNDGNACTTNDTCAAGSCEGGPPPACDDTNSCTDDTCDPLNGCVNTPDDTNTCSDGDACTQTDSCQAGSCTGSDPVVCTPLDQCHDAGTCEPTTGVCSNPAKTDGATCDDGIACTTADSCTAGVCTGGPPPNCDDGNECTDDSCDPVTGCEHANNTNPCSDGSVCTTNDMCSGGACAGGAPLDCDDMNPGTTDSCNAQTGCTHTVVSCGEDGDDDEDSDDEDCDDDSDDDDHDDDGDRDDEDSDDDNDGENDDEDSDDDNDGENDDEDSDDDNDDIDDEFDSESSRESQQSRSGSAAGGQSAGYTLPVSSGTLLLIALVESADAGLLRVEIYDPSGALVATSVPAPGRALATVPAVSAGTYTIRVRNTGAGPVGYRVTLIKSERWF